MDLPTDFSTFLGEIGLTATQRSELKDTHTLLRRRLNGHEGLAPVLVADFLQGSYRRSTTVRPANDSKADVDVVVVSKLAETEYSPQQAMDLFVPFLDAYYKGKWDFQGRSIGIELSHVKFDLVVTSAPDESEVGILRSEAVTTDDDIVEAPRDWTLQKSWLSLGSRSRADATSLLAEARKAPAWKGKPLRIPDREAQTWEDTHPLEQIRWTVEKNRATDGFFVGVVKSLKWWRVVNHPKPKHPKGFPLERIVGACCPDRLGSVGEGVARTLEAIVATYAAIAAMRSKPSLMDYGVPTHDVLKRLSAEDFVAFYKQAVEAAPLARSALDSSDRVESGNLWRQLLGPKFPKPPDDGGLRRAGYTAPLAPAVPGSGRFA